MVTRWFNVQCYARSKLDAFCYNVEFVVGASCGKSSCTQSRATRTSRVRSSIEKVKSLKTGRSGLLLVKGTIDRILSHLGPWYMQSFLAALSYSSTRRLLRANTAFLHSANEKEATWKHRLVLSLEIVGATVSCLRLDLRM
ncbi:hypothetical protein AcW1_003525 [Taiwanofungus camphoratus]|nr:hypothetical protein AcW1_003525 [Antrodia cinnamomea]